MDNDIFGLQSQHISLHWSTYWHCKPLKVSHSITLLIYPSYVCTSAYTVLTSSGQLIFRWGHMRNRDCWVQLIGAALHNSSSFSCGFLGKLIAHCWFRQQAVSGFSYCFKCNFTAVLKVAPSDTCWWNAITHCADNLSLHPSESNQGSTCRLCANPLCTLACKLCSTLSWGGEISQF